MKSRWASAPLSQRLATPLEARVAWAAAGALSGGWQGACSRRDSAGPAMALWLAAALRGLLGGFFVLTGAAKLSDQISAPVSEQMVSSAARGRGGRRRRGPGPRARLDCRLGRFLGQLRALRHHLPSEPPGPVEMAPAGRREPCPCLLPDWVLPGSTLPLPKRFCFCFYSLWSTPLPSGVSSF